MPELAQYKSDCLDCLHNTLPPIVQHIQARNDSHQNKAKAVNQAISEVRGHLVSALPQSLESEQRQQRLIILQYCISVASLEYRHAVWPYEYMALSRRVGELWERLCSSAWDAPSNPNLEPLTPPSFQRVLDTIYDRLIASSKDSEQNNVASLFSDIRDIIGEINMVEDQVFTLNGAPHVIDFKSGFGSNEKGNMLRLRTVGKAYRLWNANTRLLFLVRQEQNNNYLNVIRREGLWEVHCGAAAYKIIDEITGANLSYIREHIVDFQNDLSDQFWDDLSSHLTDLTFYLRW